MMTSSRPASDQVKSSFTENQQGKTNGGVEFLSHVVIRVYVNIDTQA
jgi:hypothetical protein